MVLPIISASERMKETSGIKGCIFGKSGVGKTSLLWTLDPLKTLFVDLEAGDLSVKGWAGDSIRPKTWQECKDLAVLIGGPSHSVPDGKPYSKTHYEAAKKSFSFDIKQLEKYETIFIDSITEASRLSLIACTEKEEKSSGKTDLRAVYGLHAQEMLGWVNKLQQTRDKNVWFVGILDEKRLEDGTLSFSPQLEGSKTGLELPGIVDQVLILTFVKNSEGKLVRAFVCQAGDPYGYNAKSRSRSLDMFEKPDLGALMKKINEGVVKNPLNTVKEASKNA